MAQKSKGFFKTIIHIIKDTRAHFEWSDLSKGLPECISASLFFVLLICMFNDNTFALELGEALILWPAFELFALVLLPSTIWMFEKRGPEDPRPIDVPRHIRVIMCFSFIGVVALFNYKVVLLVLSYGLPFALIKAVHFLFKQPDFGDFMKAGRRFAYAFMFLIFICIPLAIFLEDFFPKEHNEAYVSIFLAILYFCFFTFIEVMAPAFVRMLGIEKEEYPDIDPDF